MFEFLGAGENALFIMALIAMVMIGAVEAVGLGSATLDHDFGFDADGGWLGWLGFGRLPLLMVIVIFLAVFGSLGLIGQQVAHDALGVLLPVWMAAPAAAAAALPATGIAVRGLARILPRDETTAIDVTDLVGLYAQVVTGRAAQGSPAKARVRDAHGQTHYVMAEPEAPEMTFEEGDEIILVARDAHVFRAIGSDRPPFSSWIKP